MSILGNIFQKIFHHDSAATAQPQGGAPQAAPQAAQAQGGQPQQSGMAPQQMGQQPGQPQGQPVDVGQVLAAMAASKGGGGNYQSSIVDLLKLLDLDSSLDSRKQLANELNIHAGADGSAEENIALHRAVMDQLARNGGKVPDSLRH